MTFQYAKLERLRLIEALFNMQEDQTIKEAEIDLKAIKRLEKKIFGEVEDEEVLMENVYSLKQFKDTKDILMNINEKLIVGK